MSTNYANLQMNENINSIKNMSFSEVISYLKIVDTKVHLSEEEYDRILNCLLITGVIPPNSISEHLRLYRKTIELFPNILEWEEAQYEKRIIFITERYSNILYYFTAVICGRIRAQWDTFEEKRRHKLPQVFNDTEEQSILHTAMGLKYSNTTLKKAKNALTKIVMVTGKKLNEISVEDIYEYREHSPKSPASKATFYIAECLSGNFSSKKFALRKKTRVNEGIENENEEIMNNYVDFIKWTENKESNTVAEKCKSGAMLFINWLWINYPEIEEYKYIHSSILIEYVYDIKKQISDKTGQERSDSTVNNIIYSLRKFIIYLNIKNLISRIIDLHYRRKSTFHKII